MSAARDIRNSLFDLHGIIVYPDSDGKPMAENDPQYRAIVNTRFGLEQHYLDTAGVYVGADLLIYFEEGNPRIHVAPDVFVSLGVPRHARRTYKIWMEGKAPDIVFEFATPGAWRADLGWKRGLYQGLGVREYFLFDPSAEFFRPLLQGFRLEDDVYRLIGTLDSGRGERGIASEVLGLELWAQRTNDPDIPYMLHLYNAATSTWLPTPEEAAEQARAASARAAAEAAARAEAETRAAAAEARLHDLEAELKRLRGEP